MGSIVNHFHDPLSEPTAAIVTKVAMNGRPQLAVFGPGFHSAAVPDSVPHVSEAKSGRFHDEEIGFWDWMPSEIEEAPPQPKANTENTAKPAVSLPDPRKPKPPRTPQTAAK